MSGPYTIRRGEDAWFEIIDSATQEVVDRAFGKTGATMKLKVWNSRGLPDGPPSVPVSELRTLLRLMEQMQASNNGNGLYLSIQRLADLIERHEK